MQARTIELARGAFPRPLAPKLSARDVAEAIVSGLERDREEIRVAQVLLSAIVSCCAR